jgi:hypothetical protein
MKPSHLVTLAVTAGIAAAAASTAGCSATKSEIRAAASTSATPDSNSTTASAAGPAPTTVEQLCDAQKWPRRMPDVAGQLLSQTIEVGALGCWADTRAVAPDGHDPVNNPDRPEGDYRITAVSPPPGTPVGHHDVVTVQLADVDPNAPAAFRPCDWVTTDEAAAILGGPVTTRPQGVQVGSVDMSCGYSRGLGEDGVASELRLPGAFPVDAVPQFAATAAEDNATSVDGVGVKAQCMFEPMTTPPSNTLLVLLSGDRIYRATGWYGMSCDQLKQFAQAAIGRIGA